MLSHAGIAVVGGGIAGLAALHKIRTIAPHVEAVLIEREDRLGGKILTEHVDGLTIEGGPDSFLASKPDAIDLCCEIGLENQLESPNPKFRRTYVMRAGKLYPMPEGLSGLIPSRLAPMFKSRLISPAGKVRLGLDYVLPRRKTISDESVGDFMQRRLGREVYERLVEPLMAGIYAGDGNELSLEATFPHLRQLELDHGGLLKGIRSSRKSNGASSAHPALRSGFLTPRHGMGQLVDALLQELNAAQILQGQLVTSVREGKPGYRLGLLSGDEIEAEALILATPANVSAELLKPVNSFLASVLATIPHVSTATVTLAYAMSDIPHALDGYGYVIPRREGRPALACTWVSSKFPDRSTPGRALIRVFLGRAGQENVVDLADDALLSLAREELRQTLQFQSEPDVWRIFRWPNAMPQYTLGHKERLDTIEQALELHQRLFLAGNAYRGIGVPDCIISGQQAATAATKALSRPVKEKPES